MGFNAGLGRSLPSLGSSSGSARTLGSICTCVACFSTLGEAMVFIACLSPVESPGCGQELGPAAKRWLCTTRTLPRGDLQTSFGDSNSNRPEIANFSKTEPRHALTSTSLNSSRRAMPRGPTPSATIRIISRSLLARRTLAGAPAVESRDLYFLRSKTSTLVLLCCKKAGYDWVTPTTRDCFGEKI